ncbi:MAG TPA: YceI family protein [Streptosporangiaceae bacterium]|nr:YceI family protein [Streptosporangiaceae bacterium]
MASSGHGTAPVVDMLLRGGRLAGDWILDPSRSQIRLRSKSMWGLAKVNGIFGRASGHGTISPTGEVTGSVSLDARSLDTKNKKRDEHLRSADFFDADNHPGITFGVEGVRPSGESVHVSGNLTAGGRTRPFSFDAKVSVLDGGEVAVAAEVVINRADFGMTWNQMGMASMNNTITIRAVFTRK